MREKSSYFLLICATIIFFFTFPVQAADDVIEDGDYYEWYEVSEAWFGFPTPGVDMTGGSVWGWWPNGMFTRDFGTLNVSGGGIGDLYTYNSSTVNISGGIIGVDLSMNMFEIYNSSTVNIDMATGFVGALTFVRDTATVNISNGDLSHISAYNSSTVNIFGGEVGKDYSVQVKGLHNEYLRRYYPHKRCYGAL